MSTRLKILKNSLANKKEQFASRLDNHFATVREANGQPLNDKRNGASTLRKWGKQNDVLRTIDAKIKLTENAIEREESKIAGVAVANNSMPREILDLVANGILTQWRKHPNTFFVEGVDKARIVWDDKKKIVAHRYVSEIIDADARKKFSAVYNNLYNILKIAN